MKVIPAAADVALKTTQSANSDDISMAKAVVGALSEAAFKATLSTLAE
ncbi:uncharacterized protein METZ01_LOCUS187304, partial [marine metagenome]